MNISKNDIKILRDAKEWKMLILKRMLVYITTRKIPISDQEFFTDPKSPLKKSYL